MTLVVGLSSAAVPEEQTEEPASQHGRAWAITAVGGLLTLLALVLVVSASGEGTPPEGTAGLAGGAEEADEPLPYQLELVSPVPEPVQVAARPGTDELYVAQRPGTVTRLPAGGEGEPSIVLDRSDSTADDPAGLVGIAFSPDGEVAYLSLTDNDQSLVVDGHVVAADGTLDPDPIPVLSIPRDGNNDHAGGGLAFGPDGFLYVSVGDDLRVPEPQSLASPYGKVLRIAPRPDGGYDVPDDNPYVTEATPEIWTLGLKSPYRLAFDPAGEDLWVTDVGVARLEEVNQLSASDQSTGGVNLGWPAFEGSERFSDEPLLDVSPPRSPTFEYGHRAGRCAIIGGVLYRGERFPDLDGQFLYTDFCATALFGLATGAEGGLEERSLATAPVTNLTSVDADSAGNVYVTSLSDGILRLTD